MARSSVNERRCGTRKKESRRERETSSIYLHTVVLPSHSPSSLSVFFFAVSVFSLFVPSLLPVHLEKASPQSTLYSAAAPARALAGILL